jgi:hypothetical protein
VLEVGPDLFRDEPDSGSHSDGRQLASFDEEVHLPSRDGEEARHVRDCHEGRPLRRRIYVVRMGAHEFTLPLSQPSWTSAEESALDLCRRIADEENRGLRFSASAADVDRSARILFGFAQDALRWSEQNGYGMRHVLFEIRALQDLAFGVVTAASPGGRRRAKQLQIEASAGKPLTVCIGELGVSRLPDLRIVLDPLGRLEDYRIPKIDWNRAGNGCGAICNDSTGLQRVSAPRKWCEKCSAASSSRADRRIASIVRAWGNRECIVCGSAFTPTRRDRWRCDDCLASRRSAPRSRCSAPPSS